MKVAAITGGRSAIGRYIADLLISQHWRVKILTRREINVWHPDVEVVTGDICDDKIIAELIDSASAFFHCAAEFAQQELLWEINVNATERILQLAKESSLEYFCYLSSAGVLGASSDKWVDENTPCHPRDQYEKSKFAAELLVLTSGLDAKICVLRPVFVVSGLRPGFVEYPMRNSPVDKLKIFLKGREHAHIVHARDVAAAAVYFLDQPLSRPECFYVSCDEDELNTVAGIAGYYRYLRDGEKGGIKLPPALPRFVPHLVRRAVRGPSLHGRTRFSAAKIINRGFRFPLGFRGAIKEIVNRPDQ